MSKPRPHTITVVSPTETTDGYGDPVLDYVNGTRRDVSAYVQPSDSGETVTDDRRVVTWELTVFTLDSDVATRDRVEWRGGTYVLNGPPRVWDSPRGFHHTELRLTRAAG